MHFKPILIITTVFSLFTLGASACTAEKSPTSSRNQAEETQQPGVAATPTPAPAAMPENS